MKIFKNQRGFTIVEVLVAAGMLGVVSLGVSHVMSNMSKTMKWTESKNEEMALSNRFSYELRDQQVCTHTFVGYCKDNNNKVGRYTTKKACEDANAFVTAPVTYEWVDRPQGLGNIPIIYGRSNTEIFKQGNPYGNGSGRITLTSITFMRDSGAENDPIPGNQTNAIVRMLMTRNDGTGQSMVKTTAVDVNLTVKWATATEISECYADREDTIMTAKMEACNNIGGNFDADEDWCELYAGPETGSPTSRQNGPTVFSSRAVEQSYVDDLFRRSCLGPGRIFKEGNGGNTAPTCMVDINRLVGVCPAHQYMAEVRFVDGGADTTSGTKFPDPDLTYTSDGDSIQVTCKDFCLDGGFFQGFEPVTGIPKCFRCANNEIPVMTGGQWKCAPVPTPSLCPNTDDGTWIRTYAFDGWVPKADLSGQEPKCKMINKWPKNACPGANNVMIGMTMDINGNMAPNCCQKGSTCPDPSTVCSNGYLAPKDTCGFACPGDKGQSVNNSAQPLVYGCEYYKDTLKITRKFPEWTCGTPADPSTGPVTTIDSRDCYLGGDNKNMTYKQCQDFVNSAGQKGQVAFFSKVEGAVGPTDLLLSGKEEDSFCFIPAAPLPGIYGRESTAMVNSCTNCNFTAINVQNVIDSRTCSIAAGAGWKQASYFRSGVGNLISYRVNGTWCGSYGMRNAGNPACLSYGESRSKLIASGTYLALNTTAVEKWQDTYLPDGHGPALYGQNQMNHDPLPHAVNAAWDDDSHYDAWDQDHAGCPDDAVGVTHWESYACYAQIAGISCK